MHLFTSWACFSFQTKYVDGTQTSEVTPVTIRYIHPPHHGHTHCHEWSTHIHFLHIPHIPEMSLFQTLTLTRIQLPSILKFDLQTSQVKVMGEIKCEGHIIQPVSNSCTSFSFHINWTNNSWDVANRVWPCKNTFLKFTKKKKFQQNFSKIYSSNKHDSVGRYSYQVL